MKRKQRNKSRQTEVTRAFFLVTHFDLDDSHMHNVEGGKLLNTTFSSIYKIFKCANIKNLFINRQTTQLKNEQRLLGRLTSILQNFTFTQNLRVGILFGTKLFAGVIS